MGLLDYYRQFDDMDQEEVNQRLREKRRLEKEKELQVVVNLDLATTEWPDFPNAEVMNQAIFAARGRVNGYPDRHATSIRGTLAKRAEVDPEQIVFGNGATELLQEALHSSPWSGRGRACGAPGTGQGPTVGKHSSQPAYQLLWYGKPYCASVGISVG